MDRSEVLHDALDVALALGLALTKPSRRPRYVLPTRCGRWRVAGSPAEADPHATEYFEVLPTGEYRRHPVLLGQPPCAPAPRPSPT